MPEKKAVQFIESRVDGDGAKDEDVVAENSGSLILIESRSSLTDDPGKQNF